MGGGESTREGYALTPLPTNTGEGDAPAKGFGQRTLSQTRGRERMSALGGRVHAGGHSTDFATDERMWTRGELVNGLCRGLADGNGWSALGGESPRGREAGQWRGGEKKG